IGKIIEFQAPHAPMYQGVARRALEVADEVVFGGPEPSKALGLGTGPWPKKMRVFETMEEARDHVLADLRRGDLVLLKGARSADQLYRIVRAYAGERERIQRPLSPRRGIAVYDSSPRPEGGDMEPANEGVRPSEPLVELAPDESVVRALVQSAHPIEWIEA